MNPTQFELPTAGQVFNLASETAMDGAAEIARLAAEMQAKREGEAYRERMQRKLSDCPGFVGCYPPGAPGAMGRVTVAPAQVDDAVAWLSRRCHVGQVGWRKGLGMTVEIIGRRRGVSRSRALNVVRPQQFEMASLVNQL